MLARFPPRYLISCGLLLLPIFVWNIALTKHLPLAISTSEFSRDIPQPLEVAENSLRILVFVMPFFMPLQLSTKRQQSGMALFVFGTLVYFASWLLLIAVPQSAWATSAVGFLAPSYTPFLWLLGLALLGRDLFWRSSYRPWMYALLAVLFLAAHISHVTIVYVRNY